MVPFKDEYVYKLIFLHGIKPWVQKIIYQRIKILETYQGLMKMVECMEHDAPACSKGETGSGITQKNQASLNNGSKSCIKRKWSQRKPKPPSDKEKLTSKELLVKKAK
jgi:hypothetical protein